MPARTQACAIARLTGTPGGGVGVGTTGMGTEPPKAWSKSVTRSTHATPLGALAAPFAIWSGVSRKYAPPPADGLQYLAIAAQVMTPSMPQVPMMAPLLV